MYFLIYSSYAMVQFNHEQLESLLIKSREKNLKTGISGMLLFLEGKFIQYLEGDEVEVKTLYNKIYNDKRHKSVVVLKEGTAESRLFTDWAMAFGGVTPEEIAANKGYQKLNSPAALQIFKKLSLDV